MTPATWQDPSGLNPVALVAISAAAIALTATGVTLAVTYMIAPEYAKELTDGTIRTITNTVAGVVESATTINTKLMSMSVVATLGLVVAGQNISEKLSDALDSANDYFTRLLCLDNEAAIAEKARVSDAIQEFVEAGKPKQNHESYSVYSLYDATNSVIYIGMTTNPDKRWNVHKYTKPKAVGMYILQTGIPDRNTARIIEQSYISLYGIDILENKIRSIAKTSWTQPHTIALKAAVSWLADVAENEILTFINT